MIDKTLFLNGIYYPLCITAMVKTFIKKDMTRINVYSVYITFFKVMETSEVKSKIGKKTKKPN